MPRTILPKKPLAGIHPAINCMFCVNKAKGTNGGSDFSIGGAGCSGFTLIKYTYCREKSHFVPWQVCAWGYYNDAYPCCETCSVGEGMVDIALAMGHKIPEKEETK